MHFTVIDFAHFLAASGPVSERNWRGGRRIITAVWCTCSFQCNDMQESMKNAVVHACMAVYLDRGLGIHWMASCDTGTTASRAYDASHQFVLLPWELFEPHTCPGWVLAIDCCMLLDFQTLTQENCKKSCGGRELNIFCTTSVRQIRKPTTENIVEVSNQQNAHVIFQLIPWTSDT